MHALHTIRTHPSRRNDAHDDNAIASVQAPDAIRRQHLTRDMRRPLRRQPPTCQHRCVSVISSRRRQLCPLAVLTLKPGGAPSIAICRVLMTLKGYKHVVNPCKSRRPEGRLNLGEQWRTSRVGPCDNFAPKINQPQRARTSSCRACIQEGRLGLGFRIESKLQQRLRSLQGLL